MYAKVIVEIGVKNVDRMFTYIIPESINSPVLKQIYKDMMNSIEQTYTKLLDMGVPKEDARMILPNATKSNNNNLNPFFIFSPSF